MADTLPPLPCHMDGESIYSAAEMQAYARAALAAVPAQPVAWLCSLMMEDGTTRTQIVEQDPAGLRWNDDGEPSPYKVEPLYAAPQAVPVVNQQLTTEAQAVPVPADWPLRSKVADLLHLLEFSAISSATGGDDVQAIRTMNELRAMLAAAPKEQP
jgi:hypothetical protein